MWLREEQFLKVSTQSKCKQQVGSTFRTANPDKDSRQLGSQTAVSLSEWKSSPSKQVKKMATSLALSRFILPLLFLTCFAATPSATTTRTTLKRQPGFLYSRTRGRCTPQFWSSMKEAWPRMVPQTSRVVNVFGSRAFDRYRSDMTLLESTTMKENGNAFDSLLKQASVALLNSYAREGFPYSAWEVKTLLIQGLVSENAAARLTTRFSLANEACS